MAGVHLGAAQVPPSCPAALTVSRLRGPAQGKGLASSDSCRVSLAMRTCMRQACRPHCAQLCPGCSGLGSRLWCSERLRGNTGEPP